MTAPRPLRILHISFASDAGGLSRYVHGLCAASVAHGHEVAVAGDVGAWQWLFDAEPWPYIKIPLKGGPLAFRKSAAILRAYLAQHPVDLIHTHYRRATLVARRLQNSAGAPPILYTVHLSHLELGGPRRWFTDFGDHTHVASLGAREWVVREGRVPEAQVTLIPHGINPEEFPLADAEARAAARALLGLAAADRVAVFVGRLDIPKNEEWLLDLAAATRQSLPDLRILLVGEGPHEPDLRQRIEREGLSQRVQLLGHRDPLPIYQAADALLLPSLREGFSLVCAEAMSVGVPVFRTHTSGTEELIVEGVTGNSVAIGHDPFIAGATAFLTDATKLSEMGQAAAKYVREHYTYDKQVAQTMELYQRLTTPRQ